MKQRIITAIVLIVVILPCVLIGKLPFKILLTLVAGASVFEMLSICERPKTNIYLYVSASAITDIYYIANQTLRNKTAIKNLLSKLVQIVSIASVSESEIKHALTLTWNDFEDSVQYSVALLQEMDGIVTRNPDDYEEAIIKIWLPEELLSDLGFSENS